VVESRRQRDEETEVGDIYEGNGESDSSIGSVSNSRFIVFFNYLCTYDLYSPVRNAFYVGSILYEGKWEGIESWKSRVFRPCEMASS
jgi:hypothetical protein